MNTFTLLLIVVVMVSLVVSGELNEIDTYFTFRRPWSEALMNFRQSILSCMKLISNDNAIHDDDDDDDDD